MADVGEVMLWFKGGDGSGFQIRTTPASEVVPLNPGEGHVIAWVKLTFEYPIACLPEYLEETEDADLGVVTSGTWHRSQGTWCGDNLPDELEEALDLVRATGQYGTINSAMSAGCLCEFLVDHRVTVSAERSQRPEP